MGIQGLLPFLKAIHQPVNIADFPGSTVAIDAYCWLHKGAFSCAEKLALGEKTDQYVYYCMKYIEYMLRKNLKPILVFDGCHLKSKADVEKTRRERRELHRKKAAQFLREGKRSEAKECLQKCVDITSQMALELMNACRDRGVDCIVAPYEADAQLAYLNLKGIADIIVTEDSDLLLFGCEKIIFKMDFFGNGTLIEKSRLNEVLSIKGGFYTFEKFRHMCILSGCDYLPSIPGIGLAKACKVMKTARQPDLRQILKKLPTYLKANMVVKDEYIEGFIRADNTFLYQLVFDPLSRKLCPLNPYPPELECTSMDYAGGFIQEEKAFQIALGNIDIHTFRCIAYFDPDTFVPKNAARPKFRHHLSIWDKNYSIKSESPCKEVQQMQEDKKKLSLHDKEKTIEVRPFRRTPAKRDKSVTVSDMKTSEELVSIYGDDGENADPSLERVSRNLMESSLGFTYSATENMEDSEANFSKSNSQTKTQSAQHSKENDEEMDDSSHHECDSEEEKPRGRKRKISTTPSKPSAANIGEDAFKATSMDVQESSGSSCTPNKSKNVFAVASSAAKLPKFDLDSPAVHVKSRYFTPSKSPVQSLNTTANQARKSLKQSPLKTSASPVTRKVKQSPLKAGKDHVKGQQSIRLMFENAPILPQQIGDVRRESKPLPLTGMLKYMCSPKTESQSAKDSFKNVKLKDSDQEKCCKEEVDSIEPSTRSVKEFQQPLSIFEKFQSNFGQGGNKQNSSKHSGSAFDWSNSKSKLKCAVSAVSNKDQLEIKHEIKQTKLEENYLDNRNNKSQTESEDMGLKSSNSQETSMDNSYGQQVAESPDVHPFRSSASAQDQHQPKDTSPGVASVLTRQTDQSDDVTELQSYSYDDFIKTLSEDNQSDMTENCEIVPDSHLYDRASPEFSSVNDSVEESASQVVSADVHMQESGTSSSSAEDQMSVKNSPRNISGSMDSDYCSIIDLTDSEASSQSSSASNLSRSSSSLKQAKCRVSGLSRTKGSPLLKKSSSSMSGQRSITDLMTRFQYKKTKSSACTIVNT